MVRSATSAVVSHVRRYHRLIHGGGDEPVVWFRVHVPHPRLWGDGRGRPDEAAPVPVVLLDPATLLRLAEGLRVREGTAGLRTALAPAPRATSRVERSYAGIASLLRQPTQCLVGVPEDAAPRMRWAAAGCGLLASRVDALPAGARLRTTAGDGTGATGGTAALRIGPLPGWMVGTDVYGEPVVLHLPPGTTTLVRGSTAALVALTLPPSGRIPGEDVDVVTSRGEWEAAWHPQRSRVIVDTGAGPDTNPGVTPDVTLDLTAGTVQAGRTVIEVTPLPLRP
ncbi:hypothetical protein AALF15_05930 [Corynebacteriaceae bacterium 7-707]